MVNIWGIIYVIIILIMTYIINFLLLLLGFGFDIALICASISTILWTGLLIWDILEFNMIFIIGLIACFNIFITLLHVSNVPHHKSKFFKYLR